MYRRNMNAALLELTSINRALVGSVRAKHAEVWALRSKVKVLTGEVIKCHQDGSYAEHAIRTLTANIDH